MSAFPTRILLHWTNWKHQPVLFPNAWVPSQTYQHMLPFSLQVFPSMRHSSSCSKLTPPSFFRLLYP
jgi:hypothetical protein